MNLASFIDHTLLKAEATVSEIETLCKEAITHGFASVCVNSSYIEFVATLLQKTSVNPIAVVGFPLGASLTEAKVAETRLCIAKGAREIDMVLNIGLLKSATAAPHSLPAGGMLTMHEASVNYDLVFQDILAVVEAAAPFPVKVILETAALTLEEKTMACALAQKAKAAFVKTSTGFHPKGGATVEDVILLRKLVGPTMGVKASGGVRTSDDAFKMIKAGATRLGTSSSVTIVSSAIDPQSARITQEKASSDDDKY